MSELKKYRICPVCKNKYPTNVIECVQCDIDLTGEKIYDPNTEESVIAHSNVENSEDSPRELKMVRVCECGEKNPVQSRKCLKCGEDISDIIPTDDADAAEGGYEEDHYSLASLDGEYAYELTGNTTIIGRENKMSEYLSSKSYVSRSHAEILIEQGQVWIKNLSKTNYTFINNSKIDSDEFVKLSDGDEIGLGGNAINGNRQSEAAYFHLRISSCI